jgi:hypothetical protein
MEEITIRLIPNEEENSKYIVEVNIVELTEGGEGAEECVYYDYCDSIKEALTDVAEFFEEEYSAEYADTEETLNDEETLNN